MIRVALFLALAATASAQFSLLGGNGPDGVCRIENGAWQCYPHQSVPEASPTLILAAAGAALVLRRNGGAK
jgi:hypothetical protein